MSAHALLPYQAAFYADTAKLRVCEKSRRIGITWAEAGRQVLLAARSRSAGGMNCYYVSTSHRLGRKYIEACKVWAAALGLLSEAHGVRLVERNGVLAHEIKFASGFKVQALTSNPEALRGEGGDVVIDECAHHADLAELLKAARATGDWGGKLTLISTHNGVDNPFNALCEDIRTGKLKGSLHRVTIHDALAAGLHRRRCQTNGTVWTQADEDEWLAEALASWGSDEEYLVIPSSSGGSYIRRSLIEECSHKGAVIARLELPAKHIQRSEADRAAHIAAWCAGDLDPALKALPGDRVTTVGVDFARSCKGDLSVMALLTEQPDLTKSCPLLVELRGVPYAEQWTILRHICDRIQRFGGVALDSGVNGGWLAEQALSHYGESTVDSVSISAHWYATVMPRFRAAFEEHQISIPSNIDIRDDIAMIELRDGIPKIRKERGTDSTTKKPRHGDSAIALALALDRHAKAPASFEFRRVPKWEDNPQNVDRERPRPMRKYQQI